MAASRTKNHFAYIDALRGYAFLLVLGIHCIDATMWTGDLIPVINSRYFGIGRMGVQLFYLISSFTLLNSTKSRSSTESFPIHNYFLRRIFRIAPLFWLAIVGYTLLDEPKYFNQNYWAPTGVTWKHIAATVMFVHAWWPSSINSVVPGGWSVGVEMSFYLIFPLLCRWVCSLPRSLAAVPIALLSGTGLNLFLTKWFGLLPPPFEQFKFFWLPNQMPIFMLGFVLFFLQLEACRIPVALRASLSLILLSLSGSIMLICVSRTNDRLSILIPDHFIFGVAFLLLTLALSIYSWPIVVNKAICYVGKISFSCYLGHFYVVYVAMPVIFSQARKAIALGPWQSVTLYYLAAALVTVAIGTFTYWVVEVPGIAMGRRLTDLIEGKQRPLFTKTVELKHTESE